jgi:hypothetical protein
MFSLKLPKNVNVSLKPTKRQNNPKKVSIRQIYLYKFEKKKLKTKKKKIKENDYFLKD